MGEPKTLEHAIEMANKYEQKIADIKFVLDRHHRLGSYEICVCGWQDRKFRYHDHVAALIALKVGY